MAWPANGGPGKLLIGEQIEHFSWQLSANGLVTVGIPTTGENLIINHLRTGREVRIPFTEFEHCPYVEISPDGRYVGVQPWERGRVENRYIVYDTETARVRSRQYVPA